MINEQMFQELKNSNFKSVIDNCVYLKKISNSLYGDAEILIHKVYNVQLVLITKIFHRKEEAKKLQEETILRLNLISEKILRLVCYNIKEVKELCGNFYRIQWIYEFHSHTLQDNILHRKKKELPFSEIEIINLLETILQGFQILKSVSIRHGYLQPKHIIQKTKSQNYCISDIKFITKMTEYQEALQNIDSIQQCFLSPELLKELQKGNQENSSYEKNEIFSIGLILLNCMLLEYPEIYDLQNFAIKQQKLQEYLNIVQQRYQSAQIVREMLLIDIYHRPSLEQLISLLTQFKYKMQVKPSPKPQTNYILHIDQSKENHSSLYERKYATENQQHSTTPLKSNQEQTHTRKISQLTPITHLTHSPLNQNKQEFTEVSTISQNSYFQLDTSNINNSSQRDPYNFTYRDITPERKTKPCPSPFKQITSNNVQNSSRTNYFFTSIKQNESQSQIKPEQISYDFAEGIKLNVPKSLQQEFTKLEKRSYQYLNQYQQQLF
ncbi:unnamed protein product [Paramecium sonneborni]|uniref:Protein kinase domain-containing protein n=1 Tax=Paramecium sonneborni TaxID=65129 RepID=A0A8S1PDF1_9CILI|nr:unnamed protein product [Paramecium sonneborni]